MSCRLSTRYGSTTRHNTLFMIPKPMFMKFKRYNTKFLFAFVLCIFIYRRTVYLSAGWVWESCKVFVLPC